MPNFKKTFIVELNALEHGIGEILMQARRILAFESCQLKGNIFANPFMRRKCWPYHMQLNNGSIT
jgi:hypothetical protein